MFRLVLAILYPTDSDYGYIFKLLLSILWISDNYCGYMFLSSVSHSGDYW